LDGRFESKEIGLLEVKGKVNKVPVFHILEEKVNDSSVTAKAASRSP